MVLEKQHEAPIQTVRAIAPEDLRPGDVVAILHEFDQILGRVCGTGEMPGTLPEFRAVRVRSMGSYPAVPRVIDVALPFVLVEDTSGCESLIDVRVKDPGKLPESFGVRAMKELDERRTSEAAEKADANRGVNPQCGQVITREGSD